MSTLRHLTDDELLRYAHLELDPITSTDLERELIKRMEDGVATGALYEPVADRLDEYDFTKTKDVERLQAQLDVDLDAYRRDQALLDVLSDADIDDPKVLKQRLDRLDKFDALMDDLVRPLATLQTLATTTTE